jgi:hypothetical protein
MSPHPLDDVQPITTDLSKLTANQFGFNEKGELVINSDEVAAILNHSSETKETSNLDNREVIHVSIVVSITKPGE